MADIIITTTPSVEGHQIKEYLGLICVRASGNFDRKDDDKQQGAQNALMKEVQEKLKAEAQKIGANAVISVRLLNMTITGLGFATSAYGTAVSAE